MRIARKLTLLCAMAIAAIAMTASTASAQAVEVSHEHEDETLEHCTELDPCTVVAHSESVTTVDGHAFGFEQVQSQCFDEFTGQVFEDGSGAIHQQNLTGPDCVKQACTTAGETEWPAQLSEASAGEENMEIEFCLENLDGSDPLHCTIDVHVELIDHHNAEFSADDVPCHGSGEPAAEVTGHWETDPDLSDEINVTHL